ncbi:MAG TPA: PEP-CTERM sorting domain-containing protein [Pirellulaceae bacterium]|nr:PEP-CTERM sorting domain-containing protein [Pirellulaceae bacterium]
MSTTTGTNLTWTDNSTIPGWYSNRTAYRASTGSDNNGALYSFGSANVNERALGSIASGTTGTVLFGVGFLNLTGTTITQFTVQYDGEQWRNGGNTTQHTLTFDYLIGSGITITSAGYIPEPNLDFTGPIATATAGALDGNAAPNRVAGITWTVTGISWLPGQQLYLRWNDPNDAGNDHGLGIDNFEFSAFGSVIPEPTAASGIAILCGLWVLRRRRSHC